MIPTAALFSGSVAIAIFAFGHLGATIWWMSKMNTTLQFIERDLKTAIKDAEKREEKRDEEMQAMWNKIDKLAEAK